MDFSDRQNEKAEVFEGRETVLKDRIRMYRKAREDARKTWACAQTEEERLAALGVFADSLIITPVSVLQGFGQKPHFWYPSWLQEKDAACFGTDRIGMLHRTQKQQKCFHSLQDECDAYIDRMEDLVCIYDAAGPHDAWETKAELFDMLPGEFACYVRDRRLVPVSFETGQGREDAPLPEAEYLSLAEKLDRCCWVDFTEDGGLYFGCGDLAWVGFLARYYRRSAHFIVEEKKKRIAEGFSGRRAEYRVGQTVEYRPQDTEEPVTGRIREIRAGFGGNELVYQITRSARDFCDMQIREEQICGTKESKEKNTGRGTGKNE